MKILGIKDKIYDVFGVSKEGRRGDKEAFGGSYNAWASREDEKG